MKTLNLRFSDSEFRRLNNAREIIEAIEPEGNKKVTSWEKFVLFLAEEVLENEVVD